MKTQLLLMPTQHGKRMKMISRADAEQLVEHGEAEHLRGNVYQTKVMRADVRTAPIEETPAPLPPLNGAQKDPAKRGRGRPRKGA